MRNIFKRQSLCWLRRQFWLNGLTVLLPIYATTGCTGMPSAGSTLPGAVTLAQDQIHQGKCELALETLKNAAAEGNSSAMKLLAERFYLPATQKCGERVKPLDGGRVDPGIVIGIYWYEQIIARGALDGLRAAVALAELYEKGVYVPRDYRAVQKYFTLAASIRDQVQVGRDEYPDLRKRAMAAAVEAAAMGMPGDPVHIFGLGLFPDSLNMFVTLPDRLTGAGAQRVAESKSSFDETWSLEFEGLNLRYLVSYKYRSFTVYFVDLDQKLPPIELEKLVRRIHAVVRGAYPEINGLHVKQTFAGDLSVNSSTRWADGYVGFSFDMYSSTGVRSQAHLSAVLIPWSDQDWTNEVDRNNRVR